MAFDLKSIKPHKVSRDLTGKSFLIYGEKKIGKTTCACQFPKPILLATEKGYDDIDDISAVPINSWKEILDVKKALIQEAKEEQDGKGERTFTTVIVDTIDIAYDFCEAYILAKEGVEYLDETEKMRGYRAVSREYDKFFQEIVKWGYTLVCISHATTKQIKENGQKYDKTLPTIPERGMLVVSRLVDVMGYATFEENPEDPAHLRRILILRGSKALEAGCRNRYMPEKIELSYQNLHDAYIKAIDQMRDENPDGVTEEKENLYKDNTPKADFNATMQEIKKIAVALHNLDKMDDYNKIVAEYLGKGRKVNECDESQIDLMLLILDDLRDYVKNNNIEV